MREHLAQQTGIPEEIVIEALVQKIDDRRVRKLGARPCTFPNATHTKQEEALFRRAHQAREGGYHAGEYP